MSTLAEIIAQRLDNADAIIAGAKRAGLDLSTACALIEGESDGKNIFGNDIGGVFGRASSDEPRRYDRWVTPELYHELVTRVRAGEKSNGVGPTQITWPPFFNQAEDEGLHLWDPEDNCFFGCRLLRHSLATYAGDLTMAATEYRHGTPRGDTTYAQALITRRATWEARLAGAGDTPTTKRKKRGRDTAPGRAKKNR